MQGCSQVVGSRSSAFAGARPVVAFTSAKPSSRRAQLEVYAAKGKQRMRTGGNTRMMQQMQQQMAPPTPPVDPENEEFVIFVRSKKLPQWVPLSVVKGGAAANMLVKGLETEFMRDTTVKTLVNNIGKAVYKDKEQIISALRKAYPPFKETKEFEFAFKIRERADPKAWYIPKNLMEIPPEEQLEKAPAEKVADFFSNTFGGFGGKKE
ncbi:hypothetical protein ABPG77_009817 [Micractinium sp. CCAP 211/92]